MADTASFQQIIRRLDCQAPWCWSQPAFLSDLSGSGRSQFMHLIVTHEVTNVGSDRSQLATVAKDAKAGLQTEKLEAVADLTRVINIMGPGPLIAAIRA